VTGHDLSIVIIARNEAANIARAIESVLRAIEHRPQTQVLLVDSASTDATVDIAQQYPIDIVRLHPSWYLSVAAGRHIGMRYTQGELVLHMDGDMEMDPDWVEQSVSYIQEHPEVAAVGGYWRNLYVRDGQVIDEEFFRRDPQGRILEAIFVGGASLYRRSTIEQVGGFNPFIRGEEDIDLCIRLRHAGYKVIRLPHQMSTHFGLPENSWEYCLRRIRSSLWLGYGQVPRHYWGTAMFWTYLSERRSTFAFLLGVLISIIPCLLTLLFRNVSFLAGWALIVSVTLVAYWIRKRSLRSVLSSLLLQAFIAYSAVRGFLMPPQSPAIYPTDAQVVQMR
jgi:glycosyltransferase involved in cell wall biosynthesis